MYVTFADLLDHALSYLGGDASVRNSDVARRAVLAAYQELPQRHPWSAYKTVGRVVTVAHYNTGTVAFDFTGGSSELLVTLSSGTFPSWAASGTIVINDVPYDVDERLSDTTLTLLSTQNPGEDVAAGTSYDLYQDTYAAPSDLLAGWELAIDSVGERLLYRPPSEWAQLRRQNHGAAKPVFFTYTGDGTTGGGLAFRFWPAPDAVYPIDLLYKRRPRALVFDRREVGTASVSSTAVTGVGTAFTSAMAGSVIRFGSTPTTKPTGMGGNDPATVEAVIDSVASATSLTLTAAASQALTGVAYVISDPADIDQDVHTRLLYRLVERQCRVMTRMKELPEEEREYVRALGEAREADARYAGTRVAGGDVPFRRRLADYPIGTEFDSM